jgi:hypothetical protein
MAIGLPTGNKEHRPVEQVCALARFLVSMLASRRLAETTPASKGSSPLTLTNAELTQAVFDIAQYIHLTVGPRLFVPKDIYADRNE